MAMPDIIAVADAATASDSASDWDAVVAIGPDHRFSAAPEVQAILEDSAKVDEDIGGGTRLYPAPGLAGGRLVYVCTGELDRDYDDVRAFADAAAAGMTRARDAGAENPFLLVGSIPEDEHFARALEVSLLGACAGLWQPLEARETLGEAKLEPVRQIGFAYPEGVDGSALAQGVMALEVGRRLARDLGGTNPERMTPAAFAEYCTEAFDGSLVGVEVADDAEELAEDYPLLMSVARASMAVERHHPRVVRLIYEGEGEIDHTYLLAGKGLIYDTGGADLKVGGHMAGMSRDKGGGAATAGFLMAVSRLQPRGVRVVAEIGCVRNSIGADCFVPDEIITSHAGVRVRIGNTDAEGRLVLADLLSHLREYALETPKPSLFSVATLTGHAALAMGPYSALIENGPARDAGVAHTIAQRGDRWGDPAEISRSRREDFAFILGKTKADDILSCNNAPSSQTVRGHQFPMAFLVVASGLDAHGRNSETPLPYTHVDVAGSAVVGGDWQHGAPTGAPVVALAAAFLG